MPVVGFLSGASLGTMHEAVAAFTRGLADAGFTEGRNVAIEYRWAEGHNEQLPTLAVDLVRRGVAVLVAAASTPGALAAKDATHTIPIVFFIGTDPVKVGLIKSLARPGGNITGITAINVELIAKSLEVAHTLMPPATTIGVLVNPANAPVTASEREIVSNAERTLGRRFVIVTASTPDEIELAFTSLVSERWSAVKRSFFPSAIAWSDWRPITCCQAYIRTASISSREVSCPTARAGWTLSTKLEIPLVAFSKAKRLLTCRLSK
jgi:putative tryptophan/tyrosine transport system substrate-binding protein